MFKNNQYLLNNFTVYLMFNVHLIRCSIRNSRKMFNVYLRSVQPLDKKNVQREFGRGQRVFKMQRKMETQKKVKRKENKTNDQTN